MTPILNLSGRRRVEQVRQSEAAECGSACLVMIANFHGHKIDLASLRRRFSISIKGMNLAMMAQVADEIDLTTRAVRCEPEELQHLALPAVIHWRGTHFVVLEHATKDKFTIVDPAFGRFRMSATEIAECFTGIAMEFAKKPEFKARKENNPLKLTSLVDFSPNVTRGLMISIGLSLIIELLFLAAPFYMQLVIDDALVSGNVNLLQSLALAFGVIMVFRVGSVALRAIVIQFVSQNLSFEMQAKVYHHLIRLPMEWFSKRQVGDIQSRFGSIQPIQQFIANGAITGMLDGFLGLFVLALMFYYSGVLTAIVLASLAIYVAIRLGTLSLQKKLAGDVIINQAFEQTRFLESLRAAMTIKATGSELAKESQQRNAMAAAINSVIRAGNLRLSSNAATAFVDGVADILVIYIGAMAVIVGDLTIGMLMAFVAYKQQFGTRFVNLVETYVAWRLLSVDLGRLSDIALSKKEQGIDGGGHTGTVEGNLVCQNLMYRYGFGDDPTIRNIDFEVKPGEYVAIYGPSGGGKSTLVKLLVGLYRPTSGKILLDGRPLSEWNVKDLRRQVSLVTQEDSLMAGSIAENIALFDDQIDMDRVRLCSKLARISDEIEQMPMCYETLVGDMGSSLSSGQKQRVIIARALYRQPRILILDEGTSHLDPANERDLNQALSQIQITRIVVAHRPDTIAAADRAIELRDGRLIKHSSEALARAFMGGHRSAQKASTQTGTAQ